MGKLLISFGAGFWSVVVLRKFLCTPFGSVVNAERGMLLIENGLIHDNCSCGFAVLAGLSIGLRVCWLLAPHLF
jgi:hypothetical protein